MLSDNFCPACGSDDPNEIIPAYHRKAWYCTQCEEWWGNVPATYPKAPCCKDEDGVALNTRVDGDPPKPQYLWFCDRCDQHFGLAPTPSVQSRRSSSMGPTFPSRSL